MARLCQTEGLTEDQQEILKAVRQFVEEQIMPVATELEHRDEYPTEIVEGLKERLPRSPLQGPPRGQAIARISIGEVRLPAKENQRRRSRRHHRLRHSDDDLP